MAHIIYDKATNQPLMIVVNATATHIASLQQQCKNDPTKVLHVIDDNVYSSFSHPDDIVSSIVQAVAVDLADSAPVITDG